MVRKVPIQSSWGDYDPQGPIIERDVPFYRDGWELGPRATSAIGRENRQVSWYRDFGWFWYLKRAIRTRQAELEGAHK